MRFVNWTSFVVVVIAIAVLSCVACADVVTPYIIEATQGNEWWPCSWVSSTGDAYCYYQADRVNTNGQVSRSIIGRKITGTYPGPEFPVLEGSSGTIGWNEPVIRGTAGYLVASGNEGQTVRVVDVLDSNRVVYETSGAYEPRIYNKILAWTDNNHIYYRDLGAADPVTVTAATNTGGQWMGHPDIDGDYISYQYYDGLQNYVMLYQISTGTTTTVADDGASFAPHVGGGYVAYQNVANGNAVKLYNIASGTVVKTLEGRWFNDTTKGPVVNSKYLVCGRDGSGTDVDVYNILTDTVTAVETTAYNGWGATIAGNRICYGYSGGGMEAIRGALVTDTEPGGTVSGTITLQDYTGDAALAPVKVELIQNNNVLTTQTTTNGAYSFIAVDPGTYSVRFSACKWLTRVMTPVEVSAANTSQINVTLPNGDINGNGTIDLGDFSIVDTNFGLTNN